MYLLDEVQHILGRGGNERVRVGGNGCGQAGGNDDVGVTCEDT